MESLERLRRYVNEHTNTDWEYATFPPQRQLVNCTDTAVFALIDAIEQEHAKLLDKALGERDDAIRLEHEVAYSTGYEAGFDEGLASTDGWSADDWTGQHEDAMAERGWAKLPVDADGEVIHVGDDIDRGDAHGHVIALMLSNYPKGWGGGLHWSIQLEGEQAPTALDLTFHHHHETVEDVLHDFICDVEEDVRDEREIIAEYAAKLRLAGDE